MSAAVLPLNRGDDIAGEVEQEVRYALEDIKDQAG